MVNVRKRGNVYEYNFDVAKIEGKRKRITKSGFKTKAEALKQGTIAYNEYLNTGRKDTETELGRMRIIIQRKNKTDVKSIPGT